MACLETLVPKLAEAFFRLILISVKRYEHFPCRVIILHENLTCKAFVLWVGTLKTFNYD